MLISLVGPSMSGKTIRRRQLQEYFEKQGHKVVVVIGGSNPKSYRKEIEPIIRGEKEGIIITDGMSIDSFNNIDLGFNGCRYVVPDVIFRMKTDECPVQKTVLQETNLEELLDMIRVVNSDL